MANPQKENGYVPIANEIVDSFCHYRLSGEEWLVLWVILRKTYGFNKKDDNIGLSQFMEMTGLKKPTVVRALRKIANKNIITIIKNDNDIANLYVFNKDFDNWRVLSKKITLSKKIISVIKKDNLPLSKKIHTIDNITKDNTKDKDFVFFENKDFKELWENYLEMRKKIRKPATKKAEELILKKLHKHRYEIAVAMVEKSIENSWQGVFELRPEESEAVMRKVEIVKNTQKTELPKLTDEQVKRNKNAIAKVRASLADKFSFKQP